ncbi:MAG: LysR family transcriptional regulator [Acidithiobacillus sp.]|nr:LysR family transcriptional regulator [Acidithiobacillus sp.]
MNLQQPCSICVMAHQNFRVSAVADSLHMSQPGVSKQIQSLEDELNIELFLRRGKRMIGRTPEGEKVFYLTQQAIRVIENIRKVGQNFSDGERGEFMVATTPLSPTTNLLRGAL